MAECYGYKMDEFEFDGRKAKVIIPENPNGKVGMKMEYFSAFPTVEKDLLKNGFHIIYVENENRWGLTSDLEAKADFIKFCAKKYSLEEKVVPIGLSCGGLFAIKFAALHPEMVSVLYLDAPVVNLLSCPCKLGVRLTAPNIQKEMFEALGLDLSTILSYRDHPLDKIPALIENKIPFVLVYGEADKVVYFEENGAVLLKMYENTGIDHIAFGKPGCDHHPHCLEDNSKVLEFILNHA